MKSKGNENSNMIKNPMEKSESQMKSTPLKLVLSSPGIAYISQF